MLNTGPYPLTDHVTSKVGPRLNRVEHRASVVAITLAWIFSIYISFTTILAVCRFYCPVPYGDMWWFVRDMAQFRSHRVGLSFLWYQHSEHRIVLPRLIFWVDLQLFRFRGIFTILCSFLLQAAEATLLYFAFSRVRKNTAIAKIGYAALLFGLMFSASQIQNLGFPFQVQFPLAFFTASGSIYLVVNHCERNDGHWTAIIFGLLAAACATLSLGCGLLVWPILVLICVIESASIKTIVTCIAAGTVMWISYFIGYHSPSQSAVPWNSLKHPIQMSAFAFTFLASALTPRPSSLAAFLGMLSLCGIVIGIILYVRVRSNSLWRERSVLVYLAIFIAATALLTSLGRLNSDLEEAATIRYRLPSLIFWACIIGLISSSINRLRGYGRHFLGAPFLALIFLVCFLLPVQQATIGYFSRLWKQIDEDSIALAFDPTSSTFEGLFGIRPDLVRDYSPFLRENRLSLFTDPLFSDSRIRLTSLFEGTSTQQCSGAVDKLQPTEGASQESGAVFGWGWLPAESHGPKTIVLGDEGNALVGLARGLEFRPDVAHQFGNPKMIGTGWSGFYHVNPGSTVLTGYAILPDGKTLCRLGQIELAR
jgi:hypothetical protein